MASMGNGWEVAQKVSVSNRKGQKEQKVANPSPLSMRNFLRILRATPWAARSLLGQDVSFRA